MPRRREFSTKIKVAAFERCKGHCEKCTARLYTGKFQYDHVIPDAMGGEPTLDNCEVLCDNCHKNKTTTEDVPRIAKAKRSEARYLGAKAKPRNIIPGSKASPWIKRMNGTVERRQP